MSETNNVYWNGEQHAVLTRENVSDLQEALDHMAANDGRWSDGNTKNYYVGTGKAYQRALITDMPEGCANFLEAVDEELPKLRTGAVGNIQKV